MKKRKQPSKKTIARQLLKANQERDQWMRSCGQQMAMRIHQERFFEDTISHLRERLEAMTNGILNSPQVQLDVALETRAFSTQGIQCPRLRVEVAIDPMETAYMYDADALKKELAKRLSEEMHKKILQNLRVG